MFEPTILTVTFAVAIVVAFVFVVAPLLNGSRGRLARAGGHDASVAPQRMVGALTLALLVGLASGFAEVEAGRFPYGAAATGIAAGLAAPLTLALTGQAWRTPLRAALTLFFLGVAVMLIAAWAAPEWAMAPISIG